MLEAQIGGLQRAGRLPLAGVGRLEAAQLQASILPGAKAWYRLRSQLAMSAERQRLHYSRGEVQLEDWLDELSVTGHGSSVVPTWLSLDPRDLADAKGNPRLDKILPIYIQSLVAAACDCEVSCIVVGRDLGLKVKPMDPLLAKAALDDLLDVWTKGQAQPIPLPRRTGMALAGEKPDQAPDAYEGTFTSEGEGADIYWSRIYPDFESLSADGRLQELAPLVFGPMHRWCEECVRAVPLDEIAVEEEAQ